MKKLINIMTGIAIMAIAAVSCTKDNDIHTNSIDPVLVGEWHLLGMKAEDSSLSQVNTDVYLDLRGDGTFELYQKTDSQSVRYDRYTGRCWSEDGILTGIYSDGKPWGAKYEYAMTLDGFILRSYNLIEEQRYVRAEIPENVRSEANTVDTRSVQASGSPIL